MKGFDSDWHYLEFALGRLHICGTDGVAGIAALG
jgi:hypothetical protein